MSPSEEVARIANEAAKSESRSLLKRLSCSLKKRLAEKPKGQWSLDVLQNKNANFKTSPVPPDANAAEIYCSGQNSGNEEQMRLFKEALAGSSSKPGSGAALASNAPAKQSKCACISNILLSPSRLGDIKDLPPLHRAAASGCCGSICSLLQAGHEIDGLHCKDTALHLAVHAGQVEAVRVLIEHRASVDARDGDGWTPLHYACMMGHLSLLQLLKDAGASLTSITDDGMSALHCAVHLRTCTALSNEARDSLLAVVRELAAWGVDIDAVDYQGWTPLHMAVQSGSLDLVKELIDLGGSCCAKDNKGSTPADYVAVARGLYHQNSLMQQLLESHAPGSAFSGQSAEEDILETNSITADETDAVTPMSGK